MKIGLFTDTYAPQINGVVTVVRMMCREFSRLGHEPIVFAPSYPDQQEEAAVWRFPSRKIKFHPESRLTWPYRKKVPKVLSELDIIHSHTPFSLGVLALWATRRYDVPHVHTYHTYFTEYRHYVPRPIRPSKRMAERISRAFCDRCHLVLAPSAEMKEELSRYHIHTPIEAMPFGIDVDTFQHPLKFHLRAELELPPTSKILLTSGRLGPEKNFSFVIDAFAQIKGKFDDIVLVVAGDGPSALELKQQTEAIGMSNSVYFLGYVDRQKLVDFYREADLFVFASKTETQGIVLLEAQAAGTPVVAVGAMGVLDVVNDGQSGHLVAEDLDAFSEAVLDLLSHETKRQQFSEAALRMAQAHSAQKSCEDLLQMYQQLLGQMSVFS